MSPKLWLFGAREVTRALVPLVTGFRVVVADHRPGLLDHPCFRGCERRDLDAYDGALREVAPDDFAVVMTRDHAVDATLVDALLRRGPTFLGMMGSRRKAEAVLHHLRRTHDARGLARLRAPVGLALGAQTDAEIALSIAAQLVAAKNGEAGGSLSVVAPPPARDVRGRGAPGSDRDELLRAEKAPGRDRR